MSAGFCEEVAGLIGRAAAQVDAGSMEKDIAMTTGVLTFSIRYRATWLVLPLL
jgi:hypothetical protein